MQRLDLGVEGLLIVAVCNSSMQMRSMDPADAWQAPALPHLRSVSTPDPDDVLTSGPSILPSRLYDSQITYR